METDIAFCRAGSAPENARKGVPVGGNMSASAIAVQEGQEGAAMVQIRDEQDIPPNVLKMTACADGVNAIDKPL